MCYLQDGGTVQVLVLLLAGMFRDATQLSSYNNNITPFDEEEKVSFFLPLYVELSTNSHSTYTGSLLMYANERARQTHFSRSNCVHYTNFSVLYLLRKISLESSLREIFSLILTKNSNQMAPIEKNSSI